MGRLIKKFLKTIDLGSPGSIVFVLGLFFIYQATIPEKYLYGGRSSCIYKNYILPLFYQGHCPTTGLLAGCNCPACGLTRGVGSIVRGDFEKGISYNRLSPIVLSVMLGVFFYNIWLALQNNNQKHT